MTELMTLPNYRPHVGSGVPGATVGANGELYVDTSTGATYVKTSGAWSKIPGTGKMYATNNGTWNANDTTSFITGTAAQAGSIMGGTLSTERNKRVRFDRGFSAPRLEVSVDGTSWFDLHSFQDTDGLFHCPTLKSNGDHKQSSGVYLTPVAGNSTDIDVMFSQYVAMAYDDSPVWGWPTTWDWPTTWYWRVSAEPST